MNYIQRLVKWFLLTLVLVTAQSNSMNFTQESQLTHGLPKEITEFWQQGSFETFQGVENVRINTASFISEQHTQCIVISPGRAEAYLKYQELAYDFFQQGYNVFLIDHRGQGLSERMSANRFKGYVKNFDSYAEDLASYIKQQVLPLCNGENKPILLGHSMGAAIATRVLQLYPNLVKSAVLSSPMFAINSGGIPLWLGKAIIHSGYFFNQVFASQPWYFLGHGDYKQKPFEGNALMHSNVRYQLFVDLYQKETTLQLGGVTYAWLKQALAVKHDIFAQLDKIDVPVLVLQAGADTVVDNQAQYDFCQQLSSLNNGVCANNKPYVIDGALHELFFESDQYRNQALTVISKWLSEQ